MALAFGLLLDRVGLPPLVGFLAAGFALFAVGVEGGETLTVIGDLGVQLLLFTIGLKLKLKSLLQPHVWAVTTLHMAVTTAVFTGLLGGLAAVGVYGLVGKSWSSAALVAFALSFSSTVFAIKVLEERGETATLHGRTAINILVMQDLVAIVFLMLSTQKPPSVWALALLAFPIARILLLRIMDATGHGELMVLFGLLLPVGMATVFDLVDLKADLGALVAGLLVGGHDKSKELADRLLGLKDLLLTGFFLAIGLHGPPDLAGVIIALVLALLMPLKVVLFFVLMTRFKLRARTSLLGSLNLANYSEFGLIVGAVGAAKGWISSEWLVIVALALSFTFVIASSLNRIASSIYDKHGHQLRRLQSNERIPGDRPIDPGGADIVIIGMGHVGVAAYDRIRSTLGESVMAIDADHAVVGKEQEAGRNVIRGDATDPDLWQLVPLDELRAIVLAMQNQFENVRAAEEIRHAGFKGPITAVALFDDEVEELQAAGVGCAFAAYAGIGDALADRVKDELEGVEAA